MDNKYHNSKKYSIRNTLNSEIYIGATTIGLSKRMVKHRCMAKTKPDASPFHKYMYDNGIENFFIELVEELKCENIEQLRKREGEMIREMGTLNNRVENRTRQEYNKEWKRNNSDRLNAERRERRKENPEKAREDYLRWKDWKQTKVECDCGGVYRKSDKSKHFKSKLHQNFILNNNIDYVFQQEEKHQQKTASSHIT